MAGRLGIRAKILIYLAILAGFIISTVWMLQGVLFRSLYRGATVIQVEDAVRTQFFLTVGAILLATSTNALILMNVATLWQSFIYGFILVVALYVDKYRRKVLSGEK